MKKALSVLLCVAIVIVGIVSITSCNNTAEGVWENATYTKDTTLGDGEKEVKVEFEAQDKSVTITLLTDKDTLGEALYEHGLINDPSFFDTANGMKADWSKDQSWWNVQKDGVSSMVGVDQIQISNGEHYELVYAK